MKRLVLAAVLSLAAPPVWAGGFNVVIGFGGALADDANCSIALGPFAMAHGDHRLTVVGEPERSIYRIDEAMLRKINAEMHRVQPDLLPRATFDAEWWNSACARPMVRR